VLRAQRDFQRRDAVAPANMDEYPRVPGEQEESGPNQRPDEAGILPNVRIQGTRQQAGGEKERHSGSPSRR
jgi:hypothetical protein